VRCAASGEAAADDTDDGEGGANVGFRALALADAEATDVRRRAARRAAAGTLATALDGTASATRCGLRGVALVVPDAHCDVGILAAPLTVTTALLGAG
jgi:hypothetical protein